MGAALIIHAGSGGQTYVGSILSLRPLVFVGLVSYSLYLWHWPLLVFLRYYMVRPLTGLEIASVLLVAFLASIGSWHFVEKPFRKRKKLFGRRAVFTSGIVATAVVVTFGVAVVHLNGYPNRFPENVINLAQGASDVSDSSRKCMTSYMNWHEGDEFYYIGKKNVEPSFAILGDSHAGALMPGIEMLANNFGVKGLHGATHGCLPMVGVVRQDLEWGGICGQFMDRTVSLIEATPSIRKVVLCARWAVNAEGQRYGYDDVGPSPVLVDKFNQASGNHDIFSTGLSRTIERLQKAGKNVYLVAPIPEIGWNVPSVLARNFWTGREMDIRPRKEEYLSRNKFVLTTIQHMREKYGVVVIRPDEILCPDEYCMVVKDGKPLYSDDNHLSVYGANFVSSIFKPIFQ
ncbi:MAG: acyltransferase [Geobacteraceae bacterium]|nr:acyltransferase [Geobacteraceae bacterium]